MDIFLQVDQIHGTVWKKKKLKKKEDVYKSIMYFLQQIGKLNNLNIFEYALTINFF